jgi:hypothetical protein
MDCRPSPTATAYALLVGVGGYRGYGIVLAKPPNADGLVGRLTQQPVGKFSSAAKAINGALDPEHPTSRSRPWLRRRLPHLTPDQVGIG